MLRFLLPCFALSGAAGLVFELVWARALGKLFGASHLAVATVLGAFMGGLALGSVLGGRLAPRVKRPLVAYGVCELGIAAWGLALLPGLVLLDGANSWLWTQLGGSPILLGVTRAVLVGTLLLPPTILMGATFPILLGGASADRPGIAALYGANTFGATLGVLAGGFYLLPGLGLRATNLTAVGVDAAVGVAAVIVGWRARASTQAVTLVESIRPWPTENATAPYPDRAGVDQQPGTGGWSDADGAHAAPADATTHVSRWMGPASLAIAGALSMALQVLLTRGLILVLGSSVYSFTMVLAATLAGITFASFWIARRPPRHPERAVAWALGGAALALVLVHTLLDDLPVIFLALLEGASLRVGTVVGIQALLAVCTIGPLAACLGAVVPLGLLAWASSPSTRARTGTLYAANTIGAILGAMGGAFVLLPWLGLEWGIRSLAIAAAGAALWLSAPRFRKRVTVGVALLAAWALFVPRWDLTVLTSGVFRLSVSRSFVRQGEIARPTLLWYRDGLATTVSVERHGTQLAMKNNGKVEASSRADMPTQILVGLLPVVLHGPKDARVFLIGYGSGVTVGSIAESPHVSRVDVAELEPAVFEAADAFFGDVNHRPENNPKVHRVVADGRDFLLSDAGPFDVIVSEPSNPWIAGVANLFSQEFYAMARTRLAPGGVFCQWAQMYELGPRNVKTIYRTFSQAFPYVYAFLAADVTADTILIGSEHPLDLRPETLAQSFADPAVTAELRRAGIERPEDLLAMLLLGPNDVAAFAAGGAVHTDDNGFLEFHAPRDLLMGGGGERFADRIFGDGWPYGRLGSLVGSDLPKERRWALARSLLHHGRRQQAGEWLEPAEPNSPQWESLSLLFRDVARKDLDDPEEPLRSVGAPIEDWFNAQTQVSDRERAVLTARAALEHVAAARWALAEERLGALPLPAEGLAGAPLRVLFGAVLYKQLRFDEARRLLEPIASDETLAARHPEARYYLGRALYGSGRFRDGARWLEAYRSMAPPSP